MNKRVCLVQITKMSGRSSWYMFDLSAKVLAFVVGHADDEGDSLFHAKPPLLTVLPQ